MNLKTLSVDELAGVVNLYPWFSGARKELSRRMSRLGEDGWGIVQYGDAAMYVPCRRFIADLFRSTHKCDCSDSNVGDLIKSYITSKRQADSVRTGNVQEERKVRVVGGDYFSQSDYDRVKSQEDGVFSKFAARAKSEMTPEEYKRHEELDLFTETLAQIYAEQGYYEHARHIYSKLILAYPEKSAYFAGLIEKLEKEN